jgi:hypothetical protein
VVKFNWAKYKKKEKEKKSKMNESKPLVTNSTDIPEYLERFVLFLNVYYQLFIIIVGLLGNSITIIVFSRLKKIAKTKFYLISLALSDICFLALLLVRYLDMNGYIYTVSKSSLICKLSVYLGYNLAFISCGLVLAFTVEKLISIRFPLLNNQLNSCKSSSKIIIAPFILFSALFYSYSLYFYDLDNGNCVAVNGQIVEEINFIDSVLTFCIPFLGILIMNVIIIRTLKRSNFNFISKTSTNRHFSYDGNGNNPSGIYRNKRSYIEDGIDVGLGAANSDMAGMDMQLHSYNNRSSGCGHEAEAARSRIKSTSSESATSRTAASSRLMALLAACRRSRKSAKYNEPKSNHESRKDSDFQEFINRRSIAACQKRTGSFLIGSRHGPSRSRSRSHSRSPAPATSNTAAAISVNNNNNSSASNKSNISSAYTGSNHHMCNRNANSNLIKCEHKTSGSGGCASGGPCAEHIAMNEMSKMCSKSVRKPTKCKCFSSIRSYKSIKPKYIFSFKVNNNNTNNNNSSSSHNGRSSGVHDSLAATDDMQMNVNNDTATHKCDNEQESPQFSSVSRLSRHQQQQQPVKSRKSVQHSSVSSMAIDSARNSFARTPLSSKKRGKRAVGSSNDETTVNAAGSRYHWRAMSSSLRSNFKRQMNSSINSSTNSTNQQNFNRSSMQVAGPRFLSHKITKMLIIVSSTFLVLNLPIHLFNIYVYIRFKFNLNSSASLTSLEYAAYDIVTHIFSTSFSCNFLLYSISGKKFRTELKMFVYKLFNLKRRRRSHL